MRVYLPIIALVCLCGVAAAEPLRLSSAPGQVSVIELYTSQGCSSCPPADAWLSRLKDSPDLWQRVIPLAFHVDYWDRLGWPDPFAASTHTRRQYRYRQVGAIGGVYTPGFVRNGAEWRGWRRGQSPAEDGLSGERLTAMLEGQSLRAQYHDDRRDLVFNLAVLGMGLETEVAAGENRNRRLREDFVVLTWHRQLSKANSWETTLPKLASHEAQRLALVVWVNALGHPVPLQATAGWLDQ